MADRAGDLNQRRAAVRRAHREGTSATQAGVATGASRQREHQRGSDCEPEGGRTS
jgi:hypothetical protein